LSQTQIENTAKCGGNLFSAMLGLARPLIKPALGALASAGLSFGGEKVLKKIFGNGIGPRKVELYKLVQAKSPPQKKALEKQLVGQGLVRGGGVVQYGGFLGMLASLGVPLAISLVKKLFGKGMQTKPPPSRQRRTPRPPLPRGKGVQIQRPPPPRFKDVPLSNIDLRKWCSYLRIPIKGIFSPEETKPLHHSPCIINLDDFGSLGTHWVCCWQTNGNYEYFDSFGLPPPLEWEIEIKKLGKKHFIHNNNQIQWE